MWLGEGLHIPAAGRVGESLNGMSHVAWLRLWQFCRIRFIYVVCKLLVQNQNRSPGRTGLRNKRA